jgi:hypothetical protein
VLNLVFSLVQTKDLSKSCSFKELSLSMDLTSGEKRETKRALVFTRLAIIDKEEEFHTPIIRVLCFLLAASLALLTGVKALCLSLCLELTGWVSFPTSRRFFLVTRT